MIYLLDTSALLVFFQGEKGVERVAPLFEDSEDTLLLSTVSTVEFGRKLRDKGILPEERDRLLGQYLSLFNEIVPVDEAVARGALQLLDRISQRLPLADSLIAASAMLRGACLVHKDKHLSGIPESVLSQLDLLG